MVKTFLSILLFVFVFIPNCAYSYDWNTNGNSNLNSKVVQSESDKPENKSYENDPFMEALNKAEEKINFKIKKEERILVPQNSFLSGRAKNSVASAGADELSGNSSSVEPSKKRKYSYSNKTNRVTPEIGSMVNDLARAENKKSKEKVEFNETVDKFDNDFNFPSKKAFVSNGNDKLDLMANSKKGVLEKSVVNETKNIKKNEKVEPDSKLKKIKDEQELKSVSNSKSFFGFGGSKKKKKVSSESETVSKKRKSSWEEEKDVASVRLKKKSIESSRGFKKNVVKKVKTKKMFKVCSGCKKDYSDMGLLFCPVCGSSLTQVEKEVD